MAREPLSFQELYALDQFLLERGRGGLSALLGKPTLLKSLASTRSVCFFVGTKPLPDQEINDLSYWDVRAFAELSHTIDILAPGAHIEIQDVFRHDPDEFGDLGDPRPLCAEDLWFRLLNDPQAPSLVSLGSTRSCHASEIMLAEMFRVDPFNPRDTARYKLPYLFGWKPDPKRDLRSSFALSASKIQALFQEGGYAWGKRGDVSDTSINRTNKERWNDYGVIFAQRRHTGKVWIVVAGFTGPGTYGSAKLLQTLDLDVELPSINPDSHPALLWTVVKVEVESRPGRRGDDRVIVGQKVVDGPNVWLP